MRGPSSPHSITQPHADEQAQAEAEFDAAPPADAPAAATASDRSDSHGDESEDECDLSGSRLGKHAHWDEAYRTELDNFQENGDEGEVWFGRDVLETAANFTGDVLRRMYGAERAEDVDILDVGCGNGTMLVGLAAQGFRRLSGSDYSAASVELARKVLARHGLQHIPVVLADLMNCDYGEGIAVVVDKGTLDAIGLSTIPNARAKYRSTVWHLLHPIGHLVITSCNSTKEELIQEFCGEDGDCEPCAFNPSCTHSRWRLVDHVKTYPTFRFGGVEGSKVCTVALEKRLP